MIICLDIIAIFRPLCVWNFILFYILFAISLFRLISCTSIHIVMLLCSCYFGPGCDIFLIKCFKIFKVFARYYILEPIYVWTVLVYLRSVSTDRSNSQSVRKIFHFRANKCVETSPWIFLSSKRFWKCRLENDGLNVGSLGNEGNCLHTKSKSREFAYPISATDRNVPVDMNKSWRHYVVVWGELCQSGYQRQRQVITSRSNSGICNYLSPPLIPASGTTLLIFSCRFYIFIGSNRWDQELGIEIIRCCPSGAISTRIINMEAMFSHWCLTFFRINCVVWVDISQRLCCVCV